MVQPGCERHATTSPTACSWTSPCRGWTGTRLPERCGRSPASERAKLVALTAFSDETHVRRSQEAGFDFHLVKPTEPLEIKRLMDMLSQVVQIAGKTEEMTRQNVAPASETKELLKEVKEDMKEVKEDIKEIKADVKELKEEVREIKESTAEEHPGDGTSPEPGPAGSGVGWRWVRQTPPEAAAGHDLVRAHPETRTPQGSPRGETESRFWGVCRVRAGWARRSRQPTGDAWSSGLRRRCDPYPAAHRLEEPLTP